MNREEVYNQLNRGVLQERLYAFDKNLDKNLSRIQAFGGLHKIIPRMSGRHVVIVAAGSSLDGHIDLLKTIQKRDDLLIFAVDMALRALTAQSITPDFVISCETSPRDFFHGIDTTDITLCAFSCMSHTNLRYWQGDIAFYNWMIREEPYETLWKRAGYDLGFLATGSVVTTQALSLVLGIPHASLLLIGNDLAFVDYPYCKGAPWYKNLYARSNRLQTCETYARNAVWKGRHHLIKRGEKSFFTNNQFLGAKYWIEDLVPQTGALIYDMSYPGISEKYVQSIGIKKYKQMLQQSRAEKRRR